jgi:hypothetical protein
MAGIETCYLYYLHPIDETYKIINPLQKKYHRPIRFIYLQFKNAITLKGLRKNIDQAALL